MAVLRLSSRVRGCVAYSRRSPGALKHSPLCTGLHPASQSLCDRCVPIRDRDRGAGLLSWGPSGSSLTEAELVVDAAVQLLETASSVSCTHGEREGRHMARTSVNTSKLIATAKSGVQGAPSAMLCRWPAGKLDYERLSVTGREGRSVFEECLR